jgi:rhodanese-related sulfurtransferase
MISPAQLDETVLFDDQTYILDIRPSFLRKRIKSLPNSHVASLFSMKKCLDKIPRNRHILVVCQKGNLSYLATYYLMMKGFPKVSSLLAGITGWREQFSHLYQLYAGQNVTLL